MFKSGDVLKLRVNKTNPKPSSNRYRFIRYSKHGDAVVVGLSPKGTMQYFNPDYLEVLQNEKNNPYTKPNPKASVRAS